MIVIINKYIDKIHNKGYYSFIKLNCKKYNWTKKLIIKIKFNPKYKEEFIWQR